MSMYAIKPGESTQEHFERLKGYLLDCARKDDPESRITQGTRVPTELMLEWAVYRPDILQKIANRDGIRTEDEPEFELSAKNYQASQKIQHLIETGEIPK